MGELVKRKPTRLKGFDYSSTGVYFLTICTQNRRCILSHVVGTGVLDCPSVELSPHGKIADKLLFVQRGGQSRTPVPTKVGANSTVSRFVSTFKRFCNKEYGENIWQDRFYDHIIRDQTDYEEHVKYIHENPIRWLYDELYPTERNKCEYANSSASIYGAQTADKVV